MKHQPANRDPAVFRAANALSPVIWAKARDREAEGYCYRLANGTSHIVDVPMRETRWRED